MTTVDTPVRPAPPATQAGPFGAAVLRKEDLRLAAGNGRYLDDLGHHALAAAFLRSPHAHARIVDIDVTDALERRRPGRHLHLRRPRRPGGRAAAAADPAPVAARAAHRATRWPTGSCATSARRSRWWSRPTGTRPRTRSSGSGSSWDVAAAVVGPDGARAAEHAVHDDVPDNVAAHMVQEVGDAPAAIDAAPYALALELHVERSASMPLEGKGVYARWDSDDRSLRVYSSTQTSTSLRFALAAKLAIPVDRVEVVTPDVGGGFGVKIMHPWPEEVLVPWAAIRLGREVKWVEDRREHFISSAHERAQEHTVRVGFDARRSHPRPGRALPARQRRLHAVRHHRADHLLDPAARPVQARAPTGSSSTPSTRTPSSSPRTAAPAGCTAAS